jgi:hypothetical protein
MKLHINHDAASFYSKKGGYHFDSLLFLFPNYFISLTNRYLKPGIVRQ